MVGQLIKLEKLTWTIKKCTDDILSFQFLFTFHYKQLIKRKLTGEPARQKWVAGQWMKQRKYQKIKCWCTVSCCTWLCFLCCCLLVSTLGVTCVNKLCSVFGHQFDHAWNTKQNHVLCQLWSHFHQYGCINNLICWFALVGLHIIGCVQQIISNVKWKQSTFQSFI